MITQDKLVVITDIGSTTTKALLLVQDGDMLQIVALYNSPTTVETPFGDVRFGVKKAILGLEKISGIELVTEKSESPELVFASGVKYHSTSSAGGGLQILVIGLTLFDSASSAKRAAYGAGGIILDTFAINDQRQASQQMLAMRNLHPDMILLCGGTDDGAISGVLRMAEIMRTARPQPKYESKVKIPTIFAGNQAAIPMIQDMISDEFDLYILPNLRPTMNSENLSPTQAKIQELFMENVMEHAPGYARLKDSVQSSILPTPTGVMRSLALFSHADLRNVLAFDIGGATTDVYTQINGHLHRTVSANLGMSYSALNVLKESGSVNLMRWLPPGIDLTSVRNYIANKCMRPTLLPQSQPEIIIEKALAREAIRMALEQHHQMHFNTNKIGYLDKLRDKQLDGFDRKFNYLHYEDSYDFHESDIDLIIAAGGIFAHTEDKVACAMLIVDAASPKGITKIAIDKDFISPHLGVLSESEPKLAQKLLNTACLEYVAWHIAPIYPRGYKKGKVWLIIEKNGSTEKTLVENGTLKLIPPGKKKISFETSGKVYLSLKNKIDNLETDLALLIDTREDAKRSFTPMPGQSPMLENLVTETNFSNIRISPMQDRMRELLLPYKGDIKCDAGDRVSAQDIIAENQFNPPRLFIVDGMSKFGKLESGIIQSAFKIKTGDEVDFDQVIATMPQMPDLPRYMQKTPDIISPVRGRVEYMDPHTGLVVLSEIQDYKAEPVTVDLAQQLFAPAKQVGRFIKKYPGDFVFKGEVLASRVFRSKEDKTPRWIFVKSPSTGTVMAVDKESGTMTLQYVFKPIQFAAHVFGNVQSVIPGQFVSLAYRSQRIEGILGLGKDASGELQIVHTASMLNSEQLRGKIVVLPFAPGCSELKALAASGIAGLICHALPEQVLSEFCGFELGVINTGNEVLPFAVLILGGFSDQAMPQQLLKIIDEHQKRHCYLAPHTRIRAGVIRPFADLMNAE